MASATSDWQERVLALKGEGKSSAEIADLVGKHPATVRKVIARATAESEGGWDFPPGEPDRDEVAAIKAEIEQNEMDAAAEGGYIPESNGDGPSREALHDGSATFIPGQTNIGDFVAEAGEPVGPMPPREPEGAGEVTYIEEPRIDGTMQVAMDFGGELAEEGTLSFTGSFPSGFFKKGDVISGSFKARIVSFTPKDKLDKKTGVFKAEPQAHVALITVLEVDS